MISGDYCQSYMYITNLRLVTCPCTTRPPSGLNVAHFNEASYKAFGPGSPYDHPEQYTKVYPMQGKYLDGTMKRFVKLYSSGTSIQDDASPDAYSMGIVPPLAAMYASHPDLLQRTKDAVTLLQVSMETVVMVAVNKCNTYIYACMHTCTYAHTHICTHNTHMRTCMHTYYIIT